MSEMYLTFAPFVFDTIYHEVWRFWYRNIVTIFLPFFMLAYLNLRILHVIRQTTTINVPITSCDGANDDEQLRIQRKVIIKIKSSRDMRSWRGIGKKALMFGFDCIYIVLR
jgi:hypothetical protein